jgi:hypothetical protein
MSTSPSWFDQEKFSRLVKKVGAKTSSASGAPPAGSSSAPPTSHPPKETKRLLRAHETATARPAATPIPRTALSPSVKASQPIQKAKTASLPTIVAPTVVATPEVTGTPAVSGPSSFEETLPGFPVSIPTPEPRSVSPLSRRTTPLPDLKSLFEYEKPSVQRPPVRADASEASTPQPEDREIETFGAHQIDSKTEAPEPISDMPVSELPVAEEISSTAPSEGQPGELELLRSQMLEFDDVVKERDDLTTRVNELSGVTQERDDARREAALLRDRLMENGQKSPATGASSDEVAMALEERDSARRDYAGLREQFETLKQEHVRSRNETTRKDPESQQEIESLRSQLAQKDEELKELHALKLDPIGSNDHEINSLREEADVLQNQFNQARDEASIAQRGLALSQKALQETRDALREATEGSSNMKGSFESLKNECATLVQQNMLLQAQHDQLSRELGSLKAKGTQRTQPSI